MSGDVLVTGLAPFNKDAVPLQPVRDCIDEFEKFQQQCYRDFDDITSYLTGYNQGHFMQHSGEIGVNVDEKKRFYELQGGWKYEQISDDLQRGELDEATLDKLVCQSTRVQNDWLLKNNILGGWIAITTSLELESMSSFTYEYWKSKQACILQVIETMRHVIFPNSKHRHVKKWFDNTKKRNAHVVDVTCSYLTHCLSYSILQYYHFVCEICEINATFKKLDVFVKDIFKMVDTSKEMLAGVKSGNVHPNGAVYWFGRILTHFIHPFNAGLHHIPETQYRSEYKPGKYDHSWWMQEYDAIFQKFSENQTKFLSSSKSGRVNFKKKLLRYGISTDWNSIVHNVKDPTFAFVSHWLFVKKPYIHELMTSLKEQKDSMISCFRMKSSVKYLIQEIDFYLRCSLSLALMHYSLECEQKLPQQDTDDEYDTEVQHEGTQEKQPSDPTDKFWEQIQDKECSVCFEKFEKDNICQGPCGHVFCQVCAIEKKCSLCPQCRKPVKRWLIPGPDETQLPRYKEGSNEGLYEIYATPMVNIYNLSLD